VTEHELSFYKPEDGEIDKWSVIEEDGSGSDGLGRMADAQLRRWKGP